MREIIREEDRSKETRKWVSTQERIGRKEEIYDTQEEHVLKWVAHDQTWLRGIDNHIQFLSTLQCCQTEVGVSSHSNIKQTVEVVSTDINSFSLKIRVVKSGLKERIKVGRVDILKALLSVIEQAIVCIVYDPCTSQEQWKESNTFIACTDCRPSLLANLQVIPKFQ